MNSALDDLTTESDASGGHRWLDEHRSDLTLGLDHLTASVDRIESWGRELADRMLDGHRLLVAGNGGSAAEAQHLTAELVGRFEGERVPLAAIALHAETSSLSAIVNDYGQDEMFARQVAAHGRPGDVLLCLSTSGASANVLVAARRARELGLTTWAMTGQAPNPLTALCDDVLAVPAKSGAAVQEVHLVAVHALCATLDARVAQRSRSHVRARRTTPPSVGTRA
ncbi:D-sedoheptulose-7-phosphate isomerase [Myceligenerans salitolerans]|uniref:SIS domain-containing protein n=1 Tax=Myceligenerans salitolerans TaxID=1230528 RepID=A0ABS3I7M6_9MICO|nr:SIS domain-containing protein [Myceligenerans salitolerans]MBO0609010.1 SIS domain-containing protein [Myceligenerans salitolerans]